MREIIEPGIDWAGTMFVLISPETKDHVWVDLEIRYAVETDTPVVGIWDYGHQGCEVPQALEEFACAIVPWDAKHIIRAAFGEEKEFLNADGSRRPPRSIPRAKCG